MTEMLPTTESEATSPGSDVWTATSAGTGDEWLPYDSEPATAPASSSGGAVDGPTITFTTAAGHQVVLTYHDMVLLALLAGASAAAWRGMQ